MPDITALGDQPSQETIEISIPADDTPVEASGDDATARAISNTQSGLPQNQPQNNDLSTSSSQILCGLDDCKEGFETMAELTTHIKAVHKKNTAGRPCTFCQDSEKYLALTRDYVEKSEKKTGEKVAIPFMEELALILHKDCDTLKNWADKKIGENNELEHPEFNDLYTRILLIQKVRLLQRTLGRFNPTGAIFQLKANHGMMETEKKVIGGVTNEPLLIEFVGEKPTVKNDE